MIGTDSGYYQIVRDSLNNERRTDEKTFASLGILGERLERLKKFDSMFSGVEFSSAVQEIVSQSGSVAV